MARKRSIPDSSQKQPKTQKASARQSMNVLEQRKKQLETEYAVADAPDVRTLPCGCARVTPRLQIAVRNDMLFLVLHATFVALFYC